MFRFLRTNRATEVPTPPPEVEEARLRERLESLEKANRLLDKEVAELKAREREVKAVNERLDRQKRELEEHVMQRVSELARANERMQMLAAIVESSDDAIIGKSLDGRIISWNGGAERMYGYYPDEVIGKSIELLAHEESKSETLEIIEAVRSGRQIRQLETTRIRKDGTKIKVSLTASPMLDALDRVMAVSAIERDITKQVRNHEELRLNENRLQLAQNAAHAGAWEWDFKNQLIHASSNFYELYGFEEEDHLHFEGWLEKIIPEDRENAGRFLRDVIENPPEDRDFQFEFRIHHPEKGIRWISESARILDVHENKVARMVGMATDITDRKRTEQELQEMARSLLQSESRLSFMLNQLLVGVAQTDLTGRFTFVNERFCGIVRRKPEELYNMRMQDITHPEDLPKNKVLFAKLIEEGTSFEIEKRYVLPDGSEAWVVNNVSLTRNADGSAGGVLAVVQDISDRVGAQKALEHSENRFRRLAEAAVVGVAETADAVTPTFVNDAFCRMLGYSREELTAPGFDWRRVTPPEYIEKAAQTLAELRQGKTIEPYERDYIHRTGRRVHTLVGMSRLEDPENPRIAIFVVDLSMLKAAERGRLESDRRLRLAQECAGVGMWDLNVVTNVLDYSFETYDLLGISSDIRINLKVWFDRMVPEDATRIQKEFREALVADEELAMEYRVRHPRKGLRWLHAVGRIMRSEDGAAARAIGVMMDITGRKEAEERAREQETLFRQVMDNVRSAFCVAEPDFSRIHYLNPAHEQIFGLSNEEVVSNPEARYRIVHPDDLHFVRYTHESMNGGELNFRYRIVKPDGSIRWIQDRSFPVRDPYGKIIRIGSMAEDITGRRQFEETLRQSEEQLRLALSSAHLGEWRWNLKEEAVLLSREARKIFGLADRTDFLSFSDMMNLVHPDDREAVRSRLLDVVDRGTNYDQEYRILLPNGRVRWITSHGHTQYHRKGTPVRMIGVSRDVTERKTAEEHVRRTSQRVTTIMEQISDGFVDIDRNYRFIYVNRRASELLGKTREEMLGRTVLEVFPHAEKTDAWKPLTNLMENPRPWSGERYSEHFGIWVEFRCYPGDNGIAVFFTDITARKRVLEAIKSREEHFRTLADSVPVLISVANDEGAVSYVNKAWTEFTGREMEEETGEGWLEVVHPSDLEEFVGGYLAATRAGEELMTEFRMRRNDGTYRWMLAHGVPRTGNSGDSEGFLCSCIDITERRIAEEQIKTVNRDLESFAYIVSHDLKAPLRGIGGYANMLEKSHAEKLDEEGLRQVRNVIEGTEQMTALINDLLAFSKVQRAESLIQEVSLEKIVTKSLQGLKRDIEECGAEIRYNDLPSVAGDAVLLAQLFQNLIGNSIKFRGAKPVVTIRADLHEGEWLVIVEDNGIGIDSRYHDRIFEIFRRLHPATKYSGTGIGLAICKKIVERHGGRIWVESEKGEGATFYFTLPKRNILV